ncbi:terpene synthase family protein [Nocardia brasiliensis]
MTKQKTYELPPLYCPFESAIHSEAAAIEAHSVEWLNRFAVGGSAQRTACIVATKSAECVSRVTPTGIPERICLASDFYYWQFALDDLFDLPTTPHPLGDLIDMASRIAFLLETPRPMPVDFSHFPAFMDLVERLRCFATPYQFSRFVAAYRRWLLGVAWEITFAARRSVPGVNDFLTLRSSSCGIATCRILIEVAEGIEIPEHEVDTEIFTAIGTTIDLVTAIDNDLVSRSKQIERGEHTNNLIDVLAEEYQWTYGRAVIEAVAIRDRLLSLFIRLRDKIMPWASPQCRILLKDLGAAVRANLDWSFGTPRYSAVGDSHGVTLSPQSNAMAKLTDFPSDSTLDPIPIPAISWLWDHVDGRPNRNR